MKIKESLDNVADYREIKEYPFYKFKFPLEPHLNSEIACVIRHINDGHAKVDFTLYHYDEIYDKNPKTTFKIFSTLAEIVKNHVEEYDINMVECDAFEKVKLDIYEKLFKRFGPDWEIQRGEVNLIARRG